MHPNKAVACAARHRTSGRHRCARVAALLTAALLGAAEQAAARDWVEVRSPNFILVTDGSPARAQKVISEFEEIRAAILIALPDLHGSPEPIRILGLRGQNSFEEVLPSAKAGAAASQIVGLYAPGEFGDTIILRLDVEGEHPFETLYHEYFHSLVENSFIGLPRWLNEGLAEFYARTEVRKGRITLGMLNDSHLDRLRAQGLMAMNFFLTNPPTEDHGSPRMVDFYAQSWAMTHMLMMDDRSQWDRLGTYLEEVGRGRHEYEAWTIAFDERPKETLEQLAAYIRGSRFRTAVIQSGVNFSLDLQPRRLSEAERLAAVGHHQLSAGELSAAGTLEAALKIDPQTVLALETLGYLRYRIGSDATAVDLLERAAQLDGHSFATPLMLGQIAMRAPSSSREKLLEAEQNILKALGGRSWLADAWSLLAQLYYRLDDNPTRTLVMLRRALEAQPRSPENRFLLARGLIVAGNEERGAQEAQAAFQLALQVSQAPRSYNLCWWGALGGFPEMALPVCEQAVRLRPDAGAARDSRGLAKALTGDYEGAILDFQAFVDSDDSKLIAGARPLREHWIEQLKEGENPFDAATLAAMSNLPF
jgi:tetratricopeptide (TPR) repeat protein